MVFCEDNQESYDKGGQLIKQKTKVELGPLLQRRIRTGHHLGL